MMGMYAFCFHSLFWCHTLTTMYCPQIVNFFREVDTRATYCVIAVASLVSIHSVTICTVLLYTMWTAVMMRLCIWRKIFLPSWIFYCLTSQMGLLNTVLRLKLMRVDLVENLGMRVCVIYCVYNRSIQYADETCSIPVLWTSFWVTVFLISLFFSTIRSSWWLYLLRFCHSMYSWPWGWRRLTEFRVLALHETDETRRWISGTAQVFLSHM